MLGLPSTTEIGKRFPKEAFYRHLKLDAKAKEEFVSGIERITLANSVKPNTANVEDGMRVHEIMVFEVQMKNATIPKRALALIDGANANAIIFICEHEDHRHTVLFRCGYHSCDAAIELHLDSGNLDVIWNAYVSQLIFGNATEGDLDERIRTSQRKDELEHEVERLRKTCMKTKQIGKRNDLFGQMKNKQDELDALRKGE